MSSLNFDILIIGSGPGGTTAAHILSERMESSICIVEEGDEIDSNIKMGGFKDLTERYRNGGAELIFGKPNISVAEGKTVGGGSEVNSGIYHPLSENLVDEWRNKYKIKNFTFDKLNENINFVENWLGLTQQKNPGEISQKIIDGSKIINKEYENTYQWIDRSGNKPVKQGMREVFYKKNKKVSLLKNTKVEKIKFEGSRAVSAVCSSDNKAFKINFRHLIIACGTFQTPLLLNKSGYKFSNKLTFNIHPHLKIASQFKNSVIDNEKVSNYQIKIPEFNSSIGASINTDQWKALMLLENWNSFREPDLETQLGKIGVFYSMIKPKGFGRFYFSKKLKSYFLSYKMADEDKFNLYKSSSLLIEMLLGLNSEKIFVASSKFLPITNKNFFDEKIFLKNFNSLSIHSVHTFSSLRMGEIQTETDSYGKLRNSTNIYITDSSLIPSPPGVNPQGILMTLVHRNINSLIDINAFSNI